MIASAIRFVQDDKAQKLIEKYLNQCLHVLLGELHGDEERKSIYPDIYKDDVKIGQYWRLLRTVCFDNKLCRPTRFQEYAISALYRRRAGTNNYVGKLDWLEMEEREYVLSKLKETYQKLEPQNAYYEPEEMLERIENMYTFDKLFTWDPDYRVIAQWDDYLVDCASFGISSFDFKNNDVFSEDTRKMFALINATRYTAQAIDAYRNALLVTEPFYLGKRDYEDLLDIEELLEEDCKR